MNKIYDCIIIGGGPAGLFLSYKLAKANLKVLVIEAHKTIGRKVCGEYLCPKGVELLLNEGFLDIVSQYEKLHGMKIFTPLGKSLNCEFPFKKNTINYGISLNRESFEKDLYKKAIDLGAEVHFDEMLVSLENKSSFVHVKTQKSEYKTRFLVGADGRSSKVAKLNNLNVKLDQKRVAIHCYLKPLKKLDRFGEMHIFDDGSYIGVDPIHNEEVNLSLVCDAEILKNKVDLRNLLNSYILKSEYLKTHFGELSNDIPIWSVFPIQHKVKQAGGSLFALVGDASGFIDPLTGEGIYNALLTSKILSEELIKSFHFNIFDLKSVSQNYSNKKQKYMKQKILVNTIFQKIIRRPWLVELIGNFLRAKDFRANAFVGIIGNIYNPIEGFKHMITK